MLDVDPTALEPLLKEVTNPTVYGIATLLFLAFRWWNGREVRQLIRRTDRLLTVIEQVSKLPMFPLSHREIGGYSFGEPTWYTDYKRGHLGTDYAANFENLLAPFDGEIVQIQRNQWDVGNMVVFRNDRDGLYMRMMHLSEIRVNQGDRVVQGQVIGVTGNTGLSGGPHLHLDITKTIDGQFWLDIGNFTDPEKYDFEVPTVPPSPAVPATFWVTVTAPNGPDGFALHVRRSPHLNGEDVPEKRLYHGDQVECDQPVEGDSVDGNLVWLMTHRSKLYIWSGGTNYQHN